MDDCRGVVLAVLPCAGRVEQHRGAQLVVGVGVRAAHPFVDHLLDAHRRVPLHVHADLEEDDRDAGVLADRAMAFGAHARVRQDLRDGVLRRRVLLVLPGLAERLDEVEGVVITDELKGIRDGLNEVFFANHGHDASPRWRGKGPQFYQPGGGCVLQCRKRPDLRLPQGV